MQCARWLEPVNLAELGNAQGQIAVALDPLLVDLDPAGAVHRLQGKDTVLLCFRGEHVFAELVPVARMLPQAPLHDVRRVDLDVAGPGLALAHVVDEGLEQRPALGVPEDGARRLLLEMKQVHLAAELSVIALLGFFKLVKMRVEFGLIAPRGAIDALQHGIAVVAAPVGACDLQQLEGGAEHARRGQVRAAAEVVELSLAIDTQRLACRQSGNDFTLVPFAPGFEVADRVVALPHFTLDHFVPRDDLLHAFLDLHEVLRRERGFTLEVVVEPVLDRGADRDLGLGIKFLDGLGQDMRRVMPQQLKCRRVIAGDDLDTCIVLDEIAKVPQGAVDPDGQRRAGVGVA